MLKPDKGQIRKPSRSIAGIIPIAVMLPPRKCNHGTCIYCPNLNVPQSYTPKSPVVMRAEKLKYNAYKQVKSRLKAFTVMGHPTDKVELIIMGGTFLSYPKTFQYQFIKECYDALNKKPSKSLEEAKKFNEKAKHRCVALCIETRPDICCDYIKRLNEFGCTRVELGVQIPDDKIYEKVNRNHKVKDVIDATRILKDAGFKVGYHIMPGLPGSNSKKDLRLFKRIFSDERFKPDQLKIYPCQVIPGSELEKIYWEGKYKPYTKEETEKILEKMLKIVPRYCRVMRIMREIPPEYLIAGTINIDLRKDIEEKLRKENIKLNEIRYREIGFATKHKKDINTKLKLKVTKYKASNGDEYFLEIANENDILFGLLRLRIFESLPVHQNSQINKKSSMSSKLGQTSDLSLKSKSIRATLQRGKYKQALIRELHVYGQALRLGERKSVASQHIGLGKQLMKKAEEITKKKGCNNLKIISGVGVREYYKKLGYKLKEGYMKKQL